MARLNIEDKCFSGPGLRRLADAMGATLPTALGLLGFVWHDSQAEGVTTCTADDIRVWCYCADAAEAQRIVDAMLRSGYLIKGATGCYIIKIEVENGTA